MSKETDISQIRKYLNGELDAKAMHLLELRAKHDQFLTEGLKGDKGTAGKDQQQHLGDLSARLQQRINKKEAPVIPFKWFAVAASVLLVFAVGGIWYFNNQKAPITIATVVSLPQIKQTPVPTDKIAITKRESKMAAVKQGVLKTEKRSIKKSNPPDKGAKAGLTGNAEIANGPVKINDTAANDTPLDEMIVMDLAAKRGTSTPGVKNSVAVSLQGKTAGVNIVKNSIKGTVISRDNGLPVVGALVKLANSPVETFTGPSGHFVLPADSGRVKLKVSYQGYKLRAVTVSTNDSVKIALQPDANILRDIAEPAAPAAKKSGKGTYKNY